MVVENDRVKTIDGFLDRLRLLDNVNAVGIFFDHPRHRAHVSLNAEGTILDLHFVFLHIDAFLSDPTPLGRGYLALIIPYPPILSRDSCPAKQQTDLAIGLLQASLAALAHL